MQKNHFLLLKKLKNAESAQLCTVGHEVIEHRGGEVGGGREKGVGSGIADHIRIVNFHCCHYFDILCMLGGNYTNGRLTEPRGFIHSCSVRNSLHVS